MAGVPKLSLDFLPRPATMTSRQHSGAKLQDGENSLSDGGTTAAREGNGMSVGFVRWLQCLHCEVSSRNRYRRRQSENTNK
jgi:hypothetical protein